MDGDQLKTVLRFDPQIKLRFPELKVVIGEIDGVVVKGFDRSLESFKKRVFTEVGERYDIQELRRARVFRAYRDFFWKIGIDPTKDRPAAEALIRRILRGRSIPRINTLVDAYNLASMKTEIALAAFDRNRVRGGLAMRFATEGEEFLGIGMGKPKKLRGGEVIISDEEKVIAIYPHRDADESKITDSTKDVLLLVCGVPGVSDDALLDAASLTTEYITRFCGGRARFELVG
ncbi:MAG: B3/4 domain-containing protein [Candidatus Bathyarchaeia archaeon]